MTASWGRKRGITPQQFANELEKHLLGTEKMWDWDNTTSLALADERLDRLRVMLPKYDSLSLLKRRDEFISVIDALRRGEVPEVKNDD